jgi:hypothetical protein
VLGDHQRRREYDLEGPRGANGRPSDPFSGHSYRRTYTGGAAGYAWRDATGAGAGAARRGVPGRTAALYGAIIAVPTLVLGLTVRPAPSAPALATRCSRVEPQLGA